jgi:hypothetical protein
MRQRIETQWHDRNATDEQRKRYLEMVRGSSHPEFVKTAMDFLCSKELSTGLDARPFVLQSWRIAPALTHAAFSRLASEFQSSVAIDVFDVWGEKPSLLPDAEFRVLCGSNRLWSRVLTYAVFGKRCDPDWVKKLRQEVPGLGNSASALRVARLLKDLDDSRFAVRRKARDELFELGETAETPMRAALKQGISLEVRGTLDLYIERLESGQPPFLGRSVIELLAGTRTPEAKEMLEFLAHGDPSNFVARYAQEILGKRK